MKNLEQIKKNLLKGEKIYKFTTFDYFGNEVETYYRAGFNAKEVKKIADEIVLNSSCNEVRHGRVTLVK